MSSMRYISAVFAVILVLPGLVAGGAFATCLYADPAPHQCGAMGVQCGEMGGFHSQDGTRESTAHRSHECSCSHSPNLPADPATAVSTARLAEASAPLAVALPVRIPFTPVKSTVATSHTHGPPAEAPPVFLLDCALLI